MSGQQFKIGSEITFRVSGNEVSKTPAIYWKGHVNGEAIEGPDGKPAYLPIWCEREGREATTIMVAISNIVRDAEAR